MGGVGNASRLTGFANAPPNPLAIGNAGGAETHTLTLAQSPSHSHTIRSSDNGYIVAYTAAYAAGSNGGYNRNVGVSDNIGQTSTVGSDGAHNNVQPTLLMNYIVKT
jgi:microcystin-dependent protein